MEVPNTVFTESNLIEQISFPSSSLIRQKEGISSHIYETRPSIMLNSSRRLNTPQKDNRLRSQISRLDTPDKSNPSHRSQSQMKQQGGLSSFESNFKMNLIGYLKNEEKSAEDMKFLKKHLGQCSFFHHYAIPMGEDVFEKSILKIEVKLYPANSLLISKGDCVDSMYILLNGSLQKMAEQKNSSKLKDNNNNNNSNHHNQDLLTTVQSMLEGPFMESGQSPETIQVIDESVIGVLEGNSFRQIVAGSANRELIESLNQLRVCSFFKEWSLIRLKPILSNSSIVSYQLHQYVYKQDDKASCWYVVIEGEFEYIKEVEVESEKNEFLSSALDTHAFKKQTGALADQNKQQLIQVKVSIVTKGEIIGVEELLPKQKRIYTVRCLSSRGILRQVQDNYLANIQMKGEEEVKKFNDFGKSKKMWLSKSTQQKMPMAIQYHSTILESKRNLAIQMMKKREEEKEQEIISTANNMNHFDKPLDKLKNAKNPITFLPSSPVTFIKPEPKEDESKLLKRELFKEYQSMKEAKNDLLSSYRVAVSKYFVDNNQRLYKKVTIKKDPLHEFTEPNESDGQKSQRSSQCVIESLTSPHHLKLSQLSKQERSSFSSKINSKVNRSSKSEHQLVSLPESPERMTQQYQFSQTGGLNSLSINQQSSIFRDTSYSKLNFKMFSDSPNLIERPLDRSKYLSEKIEHGIDIPQSVKRIFMPSSNLFSLPKRELPNTPSNERLEQILTLRSLYLKKQLKDKKASNSQRSSGFIKINQQFEKQQAATTSTSQFIKKKLNNLNLNPCWIGDKESMLSSPRREFPARHKFSSSKSSMTSIQIF